MAALRTLEDFIRQKMTVNRCAKLSIFALSDGNFQAQVENPDRSYTVDVAADPADALWNVLVPYTMRRASGAVPLAEAIRTAPVSEQIDLEEAIAAVTPDPVLDVLG